MLTAKSFVIAAAAAFAVAQVAAVEQSTLKIVIKSHDDAKYCEPGYTEVSVEGVADRFCAKDQICVADIKTGSCPEAQPGLEYGAYCDKVKTGVYGCKPKTKEMVEEDSEDSDECGEGESPMSVEGVEGIFCVKGQACVADIKDGACPGKQDGLPNGAVCGIVKTGVYGCKPASAALRGNKTHHKVVKATHHKQAAPCKPGFREVSVEGVAGVFCAKDQICAGKWGSCPTEAAPGLPYGAYCGTVKTGVLGCKPKTSWKARKSHGKNHSKNHGKCQAGSTEVSVEGVDGVFCAKDQICVADIKTGSCPEAQSGLEYGAYCDKVKTGVYGCKPKTKEMVEEDSEDSDECGEGESPMSVEGVEGIFCVKGQACVADIKDGACPGKQEGLEHGSVCGIVKTGVYGCKPASHKKH